MGCFPNLLEEGSRFAKETLTLNKFMGVMVLDLFLRAKEEEVNSSTMDRSIVF